MQPGRGAGLVLAALLVAPVAGAEGPRVEVLPYEVLAIGAALIGDAVVAPVLAGERRLAVVIHDDAKAELGLPVEDADHVAAVLCFANAPEGGCADRYVFCGRIAGTPAEGWPWVRVSVYTVETPLLPSYINEPGFPLTPSACGGVPQAAVRGTVTLTFSS